MSWAKEGSVAGERIAFVKGGMTGTEEHSVQKGGLLLTPDTFWDIRLKTRQGPDPGGSCRLCMI